MTHQLLFEQEIRSFDMHVREDDGSIMTHQGMSKELVENLFTVVCVLGRPFMVSADFSNW